ncbi:N-acetylglucosamine-6-phosphate deacetylase [Aphanothece hegewaldii CCALA 016]|uniref:N-acetylglucosamine-6-phosphate deacetylase n=1 Tax=Aphanothece hegewaldii CCALA 016 TaxID=2107694 RepID=A0A2T1LS45_9CHRO|nr:N-acetylglucosamine-6-phosphate deacetylase [Aphanothece hegewaldii]PSF32260.1 N-acetylglucosamine-6-phosphate deacetylase [Aphanothece hegewaldii CCALA 016]
MITLINARIPGFKNLKQIYINPHGIIEKIKETSFEHIGEIIDVEGDWISLGGVDLQINGALGKAFPELTEADNFVLEDICKFLWTQGIDGFLPTLVTTSVENIQRSLKIIDEYIKKHPQTSTQKAQILGVHLEGPFLNVEKRGAHAAEYLLRPSLEAVEDILEKYTHLVKIVTLAPELDLEGEVIQYLDSHSITISLGHSDASAEQARKAFEKGASMVTHAFNAMPPLHHRKPGLLAEAIVNEKVYCGLIADGRHVAPTMIDLLLRASHYEKGIFLVSDALAPMGLEDGFYPWDSRQIEVKEGTARLINGTLAGTTLPLFKGVENLVKWGICDLGVAIAMATESPRKAINLKGIEIGQTANLLRWHKNEASKQLNWERINLNTL